MDQDRTRSRYLAGALLGSLIVGIGANQMGMLRATALDEACVWYEPLNVCVDTNCQYGEGGVCKRDISENDCHCVAS